ncbi:alpha/beta hydrolase fold domain-containing protein [Coraliomargarita algicola]|uniref:Alpha/beta hydrolase fold domain-containing protein n=1 Tax=Coraliomargarita algicola TaxID=3092156 RepID=A0ABZ0RMI3_9BACT|nr:alpha/beta hydrolase fold domain-containing protein [Coraliomargarita sp. J2-16]WPJ96205.1 alpha/beta hydrolase fold domain-containing protein [Coraliomargarita sp. J2-16]
MIPLHRLKYLRLSFVAFCSALTIHAHAAEPETLAPLVDRVAPASVASLWAGYDPRAESLEVEILKEWEEAGVVLQIVRFRVGVFKGEKAMLAGVFGYPKGAQNLPGLLNIHGGGQYADYKSVLTNAKRGYATISIAWAGRIAAPDYRVNAEVVKMYWEGETENPNYRVTTDWGAVDGYHAPSKNRGTAFPSAKAHPWTLDRVESPRNSGWFLATMGARRALTFLEQQPQVDADRLGVYGHSMGGKLTVLTTGSDDRVKAAVPSCGGISDRDNDSALFRATLGDDAYLSNIDCPILFQSPSNDFHGRIDDLPQALREIQSKDWRIASAPHHNHQDSAEFVVSSQLWFDQYLKGEFSFPQTPELKVQLKTKDGRPVAAVQVDASKPIRSVDIYYTQQGQIDGQKDQRDNTVNRFWRHAKAELAGQSWRAALPLFATDQPLWVYANVNYELETAVTAANYYYQVVSSDHFELSSAPQLFTPAQLQAAGATASLEPSLMIESFEAGWQEAWFSYTPQAWARSTHKVYDPQWQAPAGAKLALQVSAVEANKLVVGLDDFAAEVQLDGGSAWEAIELAPADFKNAEGASLEDFSQIRELSLSPSKTLKGGRGSSARVQLGGPWKGADPVFNDLHWSVPNTSAMTSAMAAPGEAGAAVSLQRRQPDTMWTYKEVDGKALQLSVFLPEGYEEAKGRFPTFVVYHGGSWKTGEASWHYPDCAYWSDRGMIAVSVDYRLSLRDGVEVPLECVKDAKSAVRFLRKHASELKVDPDKMVIAGGSAGGQLAAAMATLTSPETNDECYDLSISCVPNAVVAYNPYYKCPPSLSPPNFVTEGLPPFITFLGDQDPAITVESLVEFHKDLISKGNVSEFYVGKGGKHGLCNGRNPRNPFFYWSLYLIDQFLVEQGILTGSSQVVRPEGVAELQFGSDYHAYRE